MYRDFFGKGWSDRFLYHQALNESRLHEMRKWGNIPAFLPVTAALFLVYARFGPELDAVGLSLFAHRGYPPDRLIGTPSATTGMRSR